MRATLRTQKKSPGLPPRGSLVSLGIPPRLYCFPMKMKSKVGRSLGHTAQAIAAIRHELSALDPALAVAHAVAGPFEWNVREAGFVGLIRLIIEQQVSVASAAAIWKKFEAG